MAIKDNTYLRQCVFRSMMLNYSTWKNPPRYMTKASIESCKERYFRWKKFYLKMLHEMQEKNSRIS